MDDRRIEHLPDAPVVTTTSGAVRGKLQDEAAVFLGVPFAAAPIGELRLAAPMPHPVWPGVRDAVANGATPLRGQPEATIIPEPSVPGDATLNLNIATPSLAADANLPVIVYFHGGGYTSGSTASPWYSGGSFARDGVVLVTPSYRLGFDGFGCVPGSDAPVNRAVLDWIAALEWVQQNIRTFGGDSARVTIAGQSAGGGAVLTMLGMPRAQHLFTAAWAMSPVLSTLSLDHAHAMGLAAARNAGIAPSASAWRALPESRMRFAAQDLIAARSFTGARTVLANGPRLGPVIDGDLIPRSTLAALADGIGRDKPLVIGATDDEFTHTTEPYATSLRWLPRRLALTLMGVPCKRARLYLTDNIERMVGEGTARTIGRTITDAVFRRQVPRVARARTGGGAADRTWAYQWSWPSPTIGLALHCLDVPFFFDALDAPQVREVTGDHPPTVLADEYHGAAVEFATSGQPGWATWSAIRAFGGATRVNFSGYADTRALI